MSLISEPPHGTVERLVETLLQLSDGKPGSVVELTVGPGLPVYTLDYEAIVNWDLERAKGKFWRFVVFDSADQPSIADMTLEDAPRFSSRSHGYHAEAYVDHLSRLAEQTFGEEDYQEVRVLDVPTYSTLALWMMGKSGSVFFPVQILGQSVPFSLVDEDEFQRLFGDAVIGYRESVLSGRTIVSPSFDHALKSTNGDEQDSEMADDNSEVPAAEPAAASSVEPKKKRAPRRTRAEIDAAAASKKRSPGRSQGRDRPRERHSFCQSSLQTCKEILQVDGSRS